MWPHGHRSCYFVVLYTVCATILFKPVVSTSHTYWRFRGRFTRDVKDYEAFVPRKLDYAGAHMSYVVPHFYDFEQIQHMRKRRDAPEEEMEEDPDKVMVRFAVPFAGQDHVVELRPSRSFVSPELLVEHRHRDVNQGCFERAKSDHCHYEGHVVGRRSSRAALSACAEGLSGFVFTGDDHFFVEPADDEDPYEDDQQVHLAYRACKNPTHETVAADDANDSHSSNDIHQPLLADENDSHESKYIPVTEDHDEHTREVSSWLTTPDSCQRDDEKLTRKGRCALDPDWRSSWENRFREEITMNREFIRSADTQQSKKVYWIEVAIFCDKSFVQHHASRDTEAYILTLFNVAANIWHDESIGKVIHLVLVRITLLESQEEEHALNITSDAKSSLNSFNKWAENMNPTEDHPNHHDIALLLTKNGLCKHGNKTKSHCHAVGVTMIAQGCNLAKSGAIVEDNGLSTGTTIAHVIGHLLGCTHDSKAAEDSGCPAKLKDGSPVVMARPSGHVTTWSKCSKKFVDEFFSKGLGRCFTDEPKGAPYENRYLDMLPGAMYDADYQCSDMLEMKAERCPIWQEELCKELWCLVGSSCVSFHKPAADGTPCGTGEWCYAGECVKVGSRPHAVDGDWGAWSEWSECSRTCGAGVQIQERSCDNPKPKHGGYYCLGPHKQYRACNTKPCDANKPTFRQVQCSSYDDQLVNGVKYKWKEYWDSSKEPCELVCQGNDEFFATLNKCAKNGSPCRMGTRDMCIDCECHKVDCAWVIDGKAEEDECGDCNGNGVNCKLVEDFYNKSESTTGFFQLTVIPKGSYKVDIEEKEPSPNEVGIASPDGSKWYLNGKNKTDVTGETQFGSVLGVFTTPDRDREAIFIRGPTKEDLAVMYSFTGKSPINPGISVRYNVHANEKRKGNYTWDFVHWSQCPVVCGGGSQLAFPDCVESLGGLVSVTMCDASNKPMPKSRKCNPGACHIIWQASPWSKCNGCIFRQGVQKREIKCVQQNPNPKEDPIHVDDSKCTKVKPLSTRLCTEQVPCKGGVFGESSGNETKTFVDESYASHGARGIKQKISHSKSVQKEGKKYAENDNLKELMTSQGFQKSKGKKVQTMHEMKNNLLQLRTDETGELPIEVSLTELKKQGEHSGDTSDSTEPTKTPHMKEMELDTHSTGSPQIIVEKVPNCFSNLRVAPLRMTSANKSLSEESIHMMAGGIPDAILDTIHLKEYHGKEADTEFLKLKEEMKKEKNKTDIISESRRRGNETEK